MKWLDNSLRDIGIRFVLVLQLVLLPLPFPASQAFAQEDPWDRPEVVPESAPSNFNNRNQQVVDSKNIQQDPLFSSPPLPYPFQLVLNDYKKVSGNGPKIVMSDGSGWSFFNGQVVITASDFDFQFELLPGVTTYNVIVTSGSKHLATLEVNVVDIASGRVEVKVLLPEGKESSPISITGALLDTTDGKTVTVGIRGLPRGQGGLVVFGAKGEAADKARSSAHILWYDMRGGPLVPATPYVSFDNQTQILSWHFLDNDPFAPRGGPPGEVKEYTVVISGKKGSEKGIQVLGSVTLPATTTERDIQALLKEAGLEGKSGTFLIQVGATGETGLENWSRSVLVNVKAAEPPIISPPPVEPPVVAPPIVPPSVEPPTDTTPPVIPPAAPEISAAKTSFGDQEPVAFTITHYVSGKTYQLLIDRQGFVLPAVVSLRTTDGEIITVTADSTDLTKINVTITGLAIGSHTLRVVEDGKKEISQVLEIEVKDVTPPSDLKVSASTDPNHIPFMEGGGVLQLILSANDHSSEVRYEVDWGDASQDPVNNILHLAGAQVTRQHIYQEVGEYRLKVTAIDEAGNKGETREFYVTVEPTTPPLTAPVLGQIPPHIKPGNTYTIPLTGIDPEAQYTATLTDLLTGEVIDNAAQVDKSAGKVNIPYSGNYTLQITATKGKETKTKKTTISVEPANPAIQILNKKPDEKVQVGEKIIFQIGNLVQYRSGAHADRISVRVEGVAVPEYLESNNVHIPSDGKFTITVPSGLSEVNVDVIITNEYGRSTRTAVKLNVAEPPPPPDGTELPVSIFILKDTTIATDIRVTSALALGGLDYTEFAPIVKAEATKALLETLSENEKDLVVRIASAMALGNMYQGDKTGAEKAGVIVELKGVESEFVFDLLSPLLDAVLVAQDKINKVKGSEMRSGVILQNRHQDGRIPIGFVNEVGVVNEPLIVSLGELPEGATVYFQLINEKEEATRINPGVAGRAWKQEDGLRYYTRADGNIEIHGISTPGKYTVEIAAVIGLTVLRGKSEEVEVKEKGTPPIEQSLVLLPLPSKVAVGSSLPIRLDGFSAGTEVSVEWSRTLTNGTSLKSSIVGKLDKDSTISLPVGNVLGKGMLIVSVVGKEGVITSTPVAIEVVKPAIEEVAKPAKPQLGVSSVQVAADGGIIKIPVKNYTKRDHQYFVVSWKENNTTVEKIVFLNEENQLVFNASFPLPQDLSEEAVILTVKVVDEALKETAISDDLVIIHVRGKLLQPAFDSPKKSSFGLPVWRFLETEYIQLTMFYYNNRDPVTFDVSWNDQSVLLDSQLGVNSLYIPAGTLPKGKGTLTVTVKDGVGQSRSWKQDIEIVGKLSVPEFGEIPRYVASSATEIIIPVKNYTVADNGVHFEDGVYFTIKATTRQGSYIRWIDLSVTLDIDTDGNIKILMSDLKVKNVENSAKDGEIEMQLIVTDKLGQTAATDPIEIKILGVPVMTDTLNLLQGHYTTFLQGSDITIYLNKHHADSTVTADWGTGQVIETIGEDHKLIINGGTFPAGKVNFRVTVTDPLGREVTSEPIEIDLISPPDLSDLPSKIGASKDTFVHLGYNNSGTDVKIQWSSGDDKGTIEALSSNPEDLVFFIGAGTLPTGKVTLTAVVTDSMGQIAASDPVEIEVTAPLASPDIGLTDSAKVSIFPALKIPITNYTWKDNVHFTVEWETPGGGGKIENLLLNKDNQLVILGVRILPQGVVEKELEFTITIIDDKSKETSSSRIRLYVYGRPIAPELGKPFALKGREDDKWYAIVPIKNKSIYDAKTRFTVTWKTGELTGLKFDQEAGGIAIPLDKFPKGKITYLYVQATDPLGNRSSMSEAVKIKVKKPGVIKRFLGWIGFNLNPLEDIE